MGAVMVREFAHFWSVVDEPKTTSFMGGRRVLHPKTGNIGFWMGLKSGQGGRCQSA
jgi:hypothetical protein